MSISGKALVFTVHLVHCYTASKLYRWPEEAVSGERGSQWKSQLVNRLKQQKRCMLGTELSLPPGNVSSTCSLGWCTAAEGSLWENSVQVAEISGFMRAADTTEMR
jgi:hypothetical protein